jgi:hypothetical protein
MYWHKHTSQTLCALHRRFCLFGASWLCWSSSATPSSQNSTTWIKWIKSIACTGLEQWNLTWGKCALYIYDRSKGSLLVGIIQKPYPDTLWHLNHLFLRRVFHISSGCVIFRTYDRQWASDRLPVITRKVKFLVAVQRIFIKYAVSEVAPFMNNELWNMSGRHFIGGLFCPTFASSIVAAKLCKTFLKKLWLYAV